MAPSTGASFGISRTPVEPNGTTMWAMDAHMNIARPPSTPASRMRFAIPPPVVAKLWRKTAASGVRHKKKAQPAAAPWSDGSPGLEASAAAHIALALLALLAHGAGIGNVGDVGYLELMLFLAGLLLIGFGSGALAAFSHGALFPHAGQLHFMADVVFEFIRARDHGLVLAMGKLIGAGRCPLGQAAGQAVLFCAFHVVLRCLGGRSRLICALAHAAHVVLGHHRQTESETQRQQHSESFRCVLSLHSLIRLRIRGLRCLSPSSGLQASEAITGFHGLVPAQNKAAGRAKRRGGRERQRPGNAAAGTFDIVIPGGEKPCSPPGTIPV